MQRFPLLKLHSAVRYCFSLFISFSAVIFLFSSCKPTRQSTVFMSLPRDTSIQAFSLPQADNRIKNNDLLSVEVSSLNQELDAKMNAGLATVRNVSNNTEERKGLTVDENGMIELHYLGKVKAAGLTTKELALRVQEGLLPFMKDPIVHVSIQNRRFTVMGEVSNPRVINLGNDPVTLMDALALSGDLKETADLTRLILIRDSSSSKLVKHLNLEKHDVIATSWFYMQPNDILYVTPKEKSTDKEEKRRTLQTTLGFAASIISLLFIILNRL